MKDYIQINLDNYDLIYKYKRQHLEIYKDKTSRKIIAKKFFNNSPSPTQFISTLNFKKQIAHQNITQILSYQFQQLNKQFIVYFQFDGHTLQAEIDKRIENDKDHFYQQQIWKFLTQIISALAHLQRNNSPHRSLNSSFILITAKRSIKICDNLLAQGTNQQIKSKGYSNIYLFPEIKNDFYKSVYQKQVFELGMVLLQTCLLQNLSKLYKGEFDFEAIISRLQLVQKKFSNRIGNTLRNMLITNKMDFIQLEQNIISSRQSFFNDNFFKKETSSEIIYERIPDQQINNKMNYENKKKQSIKKKQINDTSKIQCSCKHQDQETIVVEVTNKGQDKNNVILVRGKRECQVIFQKNIKNNSYKIKISSHHLNSIVQSNLLQNSKDYKSYTLMTQNGLNDYCLTRKQNVKDLFKTKRQCNVRQFNSTLKNFKKQQPFRSMIVKKQFNKNDYELFPPRQKHKQFPLYQQHNDLKKNPNKLLTISTQEPYKQFYPNNQKNLDQLIQPKQNHYQYYSNKQLVCNSNKNYIQNFYKQFSPIQFDSNKQYSSNQFFSNKQYNNTQCHLKTYQSSKQNQIQNTCFNILNDQVISQILNRHKLNFKLQQYKQSYPKENIMQSFKLNLSQNYKNKSTEESRHLKFLQHQKQIVSTSVQTNETLLQKVLNAKINEQSQLQSIFQPCSKSVPFQTIKSLDGLPNQTYHVLTEIDYNLVEVMEEQYQEEFHNANNKIDNKVLYCNVNLKNLQKIQQSSKQDIGQFVDYQEQQQFRQCKDASQNQEKSVQIYQQSRQQIQEQQNQQQESTYVVQNFKQGSRYQGYCKNGMRHGHGKFYYSDGGLYDGEWYQNMMNGYGKLYYQNQTLAYQGQWLNDMFNGTGILYNEVSLKLQKPYNYLDMQDVEKFWTMYNGQFKEDKKNGFGRLILSNGQYFEGQWCNDFIDGQGIFHTLEKQQIIGLWVQNKYVS